MHEAGGRSAGSGPGGVPGSGATGPDGGLATVPSGGGGGGGGGSSGPGSYRHDAAIDFLTALAEALKPRQLFSQPRSVHRGGASMLPPVGLAVAGPATLQPPSASGMAGPGGGASRPRPGPVPTFSWRG